MPKTAHVIFLGTLLPTLLGGCDALYDDTKGWARRLETSLLRTTHGEAEPQDEDAVNPAAVKPAEMTAPPAVPVEPVTSVDLAAPDIDDIPEPEAPEGAMAAASEGLVAGAITAPEAEAKPKAKETQTAAAPALPKPKPARKAAAIGQAEDDAVVAMMLHLSSLRSEEAAKRQWSDLQRSFPEPLGRLQAEFRRTDLGDRGTFFRVLAGPLPSRDDAAAACAALKAKSAEQYCRILPLKPDGKPKA